MVEMIQVVLLVASAVGLLIALLTLVMVALTRRERLRRVSTPRFQPPLTVFKPLKGLDEDLERNLATFFSLDYPRYELVFGVNDLDDPAIDVVRRLQAAHPRITSRLVVDTRRVGTNPKVNNLVNMARAARFDYWVISDSNVRVRPDYLTDLVAHMQLPEVGLVTSMIRGVDGHTIGAQLENLHLNTIIAGAAVVVNRLTNIPISIGKSMLLRRDVMQKLGGFEAFADYLIEDALMGVLIRKLGYQTRTTFKPVENVNVRTSVKGFISRHFRWAVCRRRLNLGNYLLECVSLPILFVLAALAVKPSLEMVGVAAGITALRVAIDMAVARLLGARPGGNALWMLPLKELIIGAIWPAPFFTSRVNWRGNIIKVGRMSRATIVARRRIILSPAQALRGLSAYVARLGLQISFRPLRSATTLGERSQA